MTTSLMASCIMEKTHGQLKPPALRRRVMIRSGL
jgi:hypothetical protein